MNESSEAEVFNRELDKLLAGGSVDTPESKEIAMDLKFASRLNSSDLSADSRVKRELKGKLLEPAQPPAPRRWFTVPVLSMGSAAAFAVLALVMLKLQAPYLFQPTLGLGSLDDSGGGSGASFSNSPIANLRSSSSKGTQPLDGALRGLGAVGSLGRPQAFRGAVVPRGSRDNYGYGTLEQLKRAAGQAAGENEAKMASQAIPGGAAGVPSPVAPAPPAGSEPVQPQFNTEGYDVIRENPFRKAADHPLSTFSIDVDAASYANTRRILNESRLPPRDAVRVEEFINYFRYDYPEPEKGKPLSINTELAVCPWDSTHKLVRIGLKGRSIPKEGMPPGNLVFLIDTSGSMDSPDKLPLLKHAFRLLVEQLRPEDRIAIVAYAGQAGLVLPSTSGEDKAAILASLDRLGAGGSTAGGAGIKLAYEVAEKNLLKKGNNRVILATDGDFNVGLSSDGELVQMIEGERQKGVFLTVLGFGTGNYQDAKMEKLADTGNGNYAYIDDILEAKKVLVQEMAGTLLTIAKDVKLQIEFNAARVQAYRLIGYENRMLKSEDFNDDKKDAGELGAGHTVTALYEIIPVGVKASLPDVDELKYQKTQLTEGATASRELLTVKFRYKDPEGETSKLIVRAVEDQALPWSGVSEDFQFAAAAAGFGMLLRGSKAAGDLTLGQVEKMARGALGQDEGGYRAEMIRLVEKARLLTNGSAPK